MATTLINTTGCNSDYIVNLSIPRSAGPFYAVLTVQDSGSNPSFFGSNSIVISTTSGYSFYGGGNSEYIRRSGDSLTFASFSSNWILINTFAYTTAGYAYLSNVSTTNLFGLGTASLSTVTVKGDLTNYGPIDQQNLPTVKGIPVVSQSNLISTVAGLGSLGYFSSIPGMMTIFISTVNGLAGYLGSNGTLGYISSTQLQSTVAGMGSMYVSTGSLISTMAGIGGTYISSASLASTVAGLGTFGYISATQLASTVEGLGTAGYISAPQVISTLMSTLTVTELNNASTFVTLGLLYISTPSLVSTVLGASNTYINSNQFASSMLGVTPYFSVPITSTITGLGTAGYISTYSLYSTVGGIIAFNRSNVSSNLSSLGYLYISSLSLLSTVAGLGRGFISLSQLTSTTTGALAQSQSNMNSTVNGVGQSYISTIQFSSTVVGLSNVTAAAIPSTLAGLGVTYISSPTLQSTVAGLGNYYVSIDQLTSTTSNIIASVGNSLPSTLLGLGSVGYISFAQTISTVTNTTEFNHSTLISSVIGLGTPYVSSLTLLSTVAGLGQLYISLDQLTSTTSNVLVLGSNFVQSTFVGLGTAGYISYAQTVSTVIGFCNMNRSNLISTTRDLGKPYTSSLTLQSTVAGLGTYYISLSQLTSTTSNVLTLGSNFIQSTFAGLGTAGYISYPQTVSTVIGFCNMNGSNLISTTRDLGKPYVSSLTLLSTVSGLGQLYISLDQLTSTTSNVLVLGSNFVQSTFAGLGTAGYISYPHTVSTVIGFCNVNRSNLISTVNVIGSLYIFPSAIQSTVAGLGTFGYVSTSQLTSTTNSITTIASGYILSSFLGMSNLGYVSISQQSSTLNGLRDLDLREFISAVNSFGQTYVSSLSLQSTVAGLGSFDYVSVSWLTSTTDGLIQAQSNIIFNNVAGLGSLTFISTSHLLSTVAGIYSITDTINTSTINTLGNRFISSLTLQSIVGGLGILNFVTPTQIETASNTVNDPRFIVNPTLEDAPPGFSNLTDQVSQLVVGKYFTIPQALSTTSNILTNYSPTFVSTLNNLGSMYLSSALTSSVIGMGTAGYISLPQLTSTTYGLFSNAPFFTSTVGGLGSLYISSLSLQSTIGGLSNYYITSARLISTTIGLSNPTATPPSMFSSVAGLGGTYLSSLSLQSTVAGLGSTYISTASLVSTVRGLGTFGYLSTGYLTSTFTGYSNPMPQIISTTAGLGQIYISSASGSILFPDVYRTQTQYTGTAITRVAYSPSTPTPFFFFADASNIYKSAFSPITATVFVSVSNVTGMACDPNKLYVSYGNKIVSYDITNPSSGPTNIANSGNTPGFSNSSSPTVPSTVANVRFRSIQNICFDSMYSNLYVCDTGNNAIRRVQLTNYSVTTVAIVNQPFSVIVDPLSQYIYVSGSAGITKICLFQSNTTLLTTQGAYSSGMYIDQSGTLAYVTSQLYSHVIEVNLSNGTVTTIGGISGNPGLVDGTTSLFYAPQGITYNPVDTCIYVADTGNTAIRQIASKIYYSTIQGMNSRGYASTIGIQVPPGGTSGQFITSSSLQLWLDAADPYATGTPPANGTILTRWNDKSGNSNHALPVNTPLYSNGYIQLLPNSYFVSPYVMNSSEQHIFLVCQYSNGGTYTINLVSGMSNAAIQVYIYNNTLVLGSQFSSQNRATVSPNIPFVVEIKTTASNSSLSINNGTPSTGGGYQYGVSGIQVGGNAVTSMYICELLMFSRLMSGTSISSTLVTKWVTPFTTANSSSISANAQIATSNVAITAYNARVVSSNAAISAFNASYTATVKELGIQMWLDSSDPNGNGVLPAIGSSITTWVDKSGKGNNATGSGTFSSNGIVFSGFNSFNTSIPTNSPYTIMYIVFSNTTYSTSYAPLIGASEGSNTGYELLLSNGYISMDMSYPANNPTTFLFGGDRYAPPGYPYGGDIYLRKTTIDSNYMVEETSVFRQLNPITPGIAVGYVPANQIFSSGGTGSNLLTLTIPDYTNNTYAYYILLPGDVWSAGSEAFPLYNRSTDGYIKTITQPSIVCYLPCGVVINGGRNNRMNIEILNFNNNTLKYVETNSDATPVAVTAGPGDSFVVIFENGPIYSYTLTRNVQTGVVLPFYGQWYTSVTSAHVGYVQNNSSYSSGVTSSIVYNPINGYYYYIIAGTIWEMHALSMSDRHTVVAGSGTGFTDAKGLQALFYNPSGITVDSYGNLYVADSRNAKIRKISYPDFTVTTLATGLSGVIGIACAKKGNVDCLYVTRTNGGASSIMEISPSPQIVSASTAEIAGTNTIVSVGIRLYSTGAYSQNTERIAQTNLAPNVNTTAANYGTPGTYQIGLYYNPLPVYYTGSIQEIIIYTLPTLAPSGAYPYPKTAVSDYLTTKWKTSYSPYYLQFIPLLSSISYVQTGPATVTQTIPGLKSGTTTTGNFYLNATTLTINSNLYAGNITAGSIRGNLYGDGTAVTSISDRRLKEDIRPIMNALDKVSSMQAVRYRLYKDPSHVWIGYIAQDLEVILPEVVRTDAEGWKSIQYTNLPALIIEAVKELNEKYGRIKYLLSTST